MVSITVMPGIGFAKIAAWEHRSGYLMGEGPRTRSDCVPLWIEPAAERAPEDYRLVLQGSSMGSRILVGWVVMRDGVPGDVDWTRVGR